MRKIYFKILVGIVVSLWIIYLMQTYGFVRKETFTSKIKSIYHPYVRNITNKYETFISNYGPKVIINKLKKWNIYWLLYFLYQNNITMYDIFYGMLSFIHNHIMFLNNSKFFAGIVMILLNVGSKFIAIQFSKSTEEYLKMNVTKQLLVFAMAWMGTRDIYTSLVLTAVFTILSDHLFNEESPYCCVPHKYRILSKLVDENNDGFVSEQEINDAIAVLEKAKKDKNMMSQRQLFTLYGNYMDTSYKSTY